MNGFFPVCVYSDFYPPLTLDFMLLEVSRQYESFLEVPADVVLVIEVLRFLTMEREIVR